MQGLSSPLVYKHSKTTIIKTIITITRDSLFPIVMLTLDYDQPFKRTVHDDTSTHEKKSDNRQNDS